MAQYTVKDRALRPYKTVTGEKGEPKLVRLGQRYRKGQVVDLDENDPQTARYIKLGSIEKKDGGDTEGARAGGEQGGGERRGERTTRSASK